MQTLERKVGSFIYILGMMLVIGVFAHSRADAQSYECAKEGERCAFAGTAEVAYGAGNKWAKKVATGSISCTNSAFGDPAPNQAKTCMLTTTQCADEGGRCEFRGPRTVRYGANNIWAVNTLKDGITCGVAAFGYDPVPNVRKQCFIGPAPEKPINQITWLGTHNAIAAPYYGISTMASQRDSVTVQLDRGARALEIDTVYDEPPQYAAGVYVCHCGAAPHSVSDIERKRWLTGKDNQTFVPFALDGWTHTTPYMRFSTILQEVDRWMIANPGEIVFILMENNSAKPAQLDAEIEAAALKTGIYRKADNNPWPTKSELVRKNKRLILQVGDDKMKALGYRGKQGESKYASPKYAYEYNATSQAWINYDLIQYGALAPDGYGNLNDYTADKTAAARNFNQLLIMGAFNSTLTDEITAVAHNNYPFLSKSKEFWRGLDAPKDPFYPSIIQVNHIHVGDALRFVNDMNGGPYLISSKHDNIGDTSGDSWQIRFENTSAGLNGGIVILYMENSAEGVPVPKVVDAGQVSLSTGVARMINIPRNRSFGTPITVSVYLYSTKSIEMYSEVIPASFAGSPVPCFALTGHLAAPKGGRCK